MVAYLDLSFFVINLFVFSIFFNRRTTTTFLLFGAAFRALFMLMTLIDYDLKSMLSGSDINFINNATMIADLINIIVLGGFALTNIFITPILLLLLSISGFDIYVATKIKRPGMRIF